VLFLQVFLGDIGNGTIESALPFFAKGQYSKAQFTGWSGCSERQKLIARITVKQNDVQHENLSSGY
jgi:hypothetical protein